VSKRDLYAWFVSLLLHYTCSYRRVKGSHRSSPDRGKGPFREWGPSREYVLDDIEKIKYYEKYKIESLKRLKEFTLSINEFINLIKNSNIGDLMSIYIDSIQSKHFKSVCYNDFANWYCNLYSNIKLCDIKESVPKKVINKKW